MTDFFHLNLIRKYDKMVLRHNKQIFPVIKLCLCFTLLVKMQALFRRGFLRAKVVSQQLKGYAFFVRGSWAAHFLFLGVFMAKSFGEHLRNLRIEKGLTQRDVGDYLNINRTTYTKYETNVTEPDLKRLKLLCELFEVDYNTLLNH